MPLEDGSASGSYIQAAGMGQLVAATKAFTPLPWFFFPEDSQAQGTFKSVSMMRPSSARQPMTAEERRRPPSAAREARLRQLQAQQQPPSRVQAAKPVPIIKPPTAPAKPAVSAMEHAMEYAPYVEEVLQENSDKQDLVEELRAAIKKRAADPSGFSGINGLARAFRVNDRDGSGALDLTEFTRCVANCKLNIDASTIARLHAAFDRDNSGYISYEEFVQAVRGPMSAARRKMVVQVFNALDALGNGDGHLAIADLARYYDASKHPAVRGGHMDANGACT